MAKKKKKTQEAAKPDPFVALGGQALEYARTNVTVVILFGFLLIAGTAFALYWPQLKENRELEAAAKLVEAEELLKDANPIAGLGFSMGDPKPEDLKKALDVYERVAAEHPGSAAGRRALVMAGDTNMKLADQASRQEKPSYYSAAESLYQKASSLGSASERYYALNGLGSAREAQENYAGAVEAYKQIVDDQRLPYRDTASLDLARALFKNGQSDEAMLQLAEFEETYPSSGMKDHAKALALLYGGQSSSASPESTPDPEAGG